MRLNHTPEMEKAMYQSHGVGYAEYSRNFNKRMQVERERELDHRRSLKMVSEFDRKLSR